MKILLAMSGGVDSSVAASLLLEQGYRLEGVYLRHALQVRPEEEQDAKRAAALLGIPLHIVDVDSMFSQVLARFTSDYLAAKTPNPCALCNRLIKFGTLIEFAEPLGAQGFATGHYVKKIERPTANGISHELHRAKDLSKDQSYLLYGIARKHLPKLHFPLGDLLKSEVRERAAALALHVAEKKDSQEICFVEPHKHAEFVRARCPNRDTAGEFVSCDGTFLARHHGYEHFTIGQRKGLKTGFTQRMYVVDIDAETRKITLGTHDQLAVVSLKAGEIHWLEEPPLDEAFRCEVKIRYRNEPEAATVVLRKTDDATNLEMSIAFDAPKYGVAPGQIAACYQNARLLGGGTILTTQRSDFPK